MNGYLLDTNHAGAAMRDDPRLAAAIRARPDQTLCVSIPTVGELWYMVLNSARIAENTRRLEGLLSALVVIPYDEPAARRFGQVRTDLRRMGTPIPAVDTQIAAIALHNDLTVATADKHFDAVSGLRVENWLT